MDESDLRNISASDDAGQNQVQKTSAQDSFQQPDHLALPREAQIGNSSSTLSTNEDHVLSHDAISTTTEPQVSLPHETVMHSGVITGNDNGNESTSSTEQPHTKPVVETDENGPPHSMTDLELPLSFKQSLGLAGTASIVGGYIGILLVGGFLVYLWFGSGPSLEAAHATYLWRQIAIHSWMAQTITLCALILRLIISLQSTVCTSMIAALVLERRSVRRFQVPYFSIFRSVNSGPRKLFEIMSLSDTKMFRHIEFWLVLVLVLVTTALQFTSTVLISDMNNFVMVGDMNETQVPSLLSYNESDFDFRLIGGAFLNRMPMFEMFAESLSRRDASPNEFGLSDTGLVQRGLLPLTESSSRTSLRSLDGNLLTFNSRVACMPPVVDMHYETVDMEAAGADYRFVSGRLQYGSSLDNAKASQSPDCTSTDCQETGFECVLPFSLNRRPDKWESVSCLINGVGGQYWGIDLNQKWTSESEPWSTNSTIELVFTTNMRRIDWTNLDLNGTLGVGVPYQEWLSFTPVPDRHVNISVCFSAFNLAREHVSIMAAGRLSEPSANWTMTSSDYNTSDIQRYMGFSAPNQPHDEREILTLNNIGDPEDGPPGSPAYTNIILNGTHGVENHTISDLTVRVLEEIIDYQLTEAKSVNLTRLICSTCDAQGDPVHPVVAMVFNSIIAETSRAANAIQSFMMISVFSWYDAYISSLGQLQTVNMTTTKAVQIPGPCRSVQDCGGFYSVAILLIVHLVYVAVITALFIKQARYSLYGNIWHTISQLVGDELRVALDYSNNARDKAVKSFCKTQGNDFVRLERVPDTDMIELINLSKKHSSQLEK